MKVNDLPKEVQHYCNDELNPLANIAEIPLHQHNIQMLLQMNTTGELELTPSASSDLQNNFTMLNDSIHLLENDSLAAVEDDVFLSPLEQENADFQIALGNWLK